MTHQPSIFATLFRTLPPMACIAIAPSIEANARHRACPGRQKNEFRGR